MRNAAAILALALTLLAADAFATKITIRNVDDAGKGFNDPTPAAPVGGNSGTTLGEQRLNAFRYAASVWEKLLSSKVEIVISARWRTDMTCTATSATLGAAGPTYVVSDFPNAPKQGVWYPVALANSMAGEDLVKDDETGPKPDISAQFNSQIDSPSCLGDTGWYYGLDGNSGGNIDLVVVLLHEFAHGLGVTGVTQLGVDNQNPTQQGTMLQGMPSVFEMHTLDLKTGLRWDQMTDEQRRTSMTRTGALVWDGESTRFGAQQTLNPVVTLTVTSPSQIARNFDIGAAAFGPRADQSAVSGSIVAATDAANAAGPSTIDGCSAFDNASLVSGKIVLVERGTCTFVQKAANAQSAGASAVIVADNLHDTCLPPGMAGDSASILIPVISVSMDDGKAIRQELAAGTSVSAMLRVDPATLAGASSMGYVRLYTPCTIAPGSSVHHWDVTALPNLLMEPNINSDLGHGVDITVNQLMDIGWTRLGDPGPPKGRRVLKRGR